MNKTVRRETQGGDAQIRQRSRLEARITAGNWRVRAYIAYSTETGSRDYLSVFMNVRQESREFGRWDIWSNLARFDPKEGRVNYWYVYVQNSQALSTNLRTSIKLSHTYNCRSGDRHVIAMALELEAGI
jgi:hypothetical protein